MVYKSDSNQQILLSEFREFMTSPVVPIKDLVDHKNEPLSMIMAYWRRHHLLPYFPKGRWCTEISFSQLIWLRLLDVLREFGVSLHYMSKLCNYFFKDAYDNNLPLKNLHYNHKELKNKIEQGNHTDNDEYLIKEIELMLKDKILLYGLKLDINYFTMLMAKGLDALEDFGLLLFLSGEIYEYVGEEIYSHKTSEKLFDFNQPNIKLSLKYFLDEFVNKDELEKFLIPTLLNDNEKEVLKALRKNNTCITIKKQGDEIVSINSSKDGLIKDDEAKQIRRILGIGNYEEITISTRDNKTLFFKKTKKNRLR